MTSSRMEWPQVHAMNPSGLPPRVPRIITAAALLVPVLMSCHAGKRTPQFNWVATPREGIHQLSYCRELLTDRRREDFVLDSGESPARFVLEDGSVFTLNASTPPGTHVLRGGAVLEVHSPPGLRREYQIVHPERFSVAMRVKTPSHFVAVCFPHQKDLPLTIDEIRRDAASLLSPHHREHGVPEIFRAAPIATPVIELADELSVQCRVYVVTFDPNQPIGNAEVWGRLTDLERCAAAIRSPQSRVLAKLLVDKAKKTVSELPEESTLDFGNHLKPLDSNRAYLGTSRRRP